MISPSNRNDACTKILETLSLSAELIARFTPVMLRDKGASFTGSGVILLNDPSRKEMWVATAKHNIWFYASSKGGYPGDPVTWIEKNEKANDLQIQRLFLTDVEVHYESVDLASMNQVAPTATTKAAIDDIEFFHPGYQYDACLLRVSYTQQTAPRAALLSRFMAVPMLREIRKRMQLLEKNGAIGGSGGLVQAGFGAQGQKKTKEETKNGTLLYKQSAFAKYVRQSYYDDHVGAYTDVYELQSDQTWTTLPGDSGGPLFLIENNACLPIGVTLGADSFASQKDEPKSLATDPDGKYNNTATSLLPIYQALLDRYDTDDE